MIEQILTYLGGVAYALAGWLLIVSIVLFLTMGYDKAQARRGGYRIPEKRLFLLAALGGAIGGLAGMFAFRHKTRHWYFVWGFSALAILHSAALIYVALTV